MPDYRIYGPDENGKMKEQPVEKLASFMGVSEFDANLLIKGMNITKAICVAVGIQEEPPLVWNENMPADLVEFVTGHVADQLKENPAWELGDFDWSLLYDGNTLKYR